MKESSRKQQDALIIAISAAVVAGMAIAALLVAWWRHSPSMLANGFVVSEAQPQTVTRRGKHAFRSTKARRCIAPRCGVRGADASIHETEPLFDRLRMTLRRLHAKCRKRACPSTRSSVKAPKRGRGGGVEGDRRPRDVCSTAPFLVSRHSRRCIRSIFPPGLQHSASVLAYRKMLYSLSPASSHIAIFSARIRWRC